MRAILISMGSLGDMLPFVYLAQSLVDQGHDVLLLGCDEYRGMVRDSRIEFHPIMSTNVYRNNIESRRKTIGQARPVLDFFHWSCSQIEPVYRLLADCYVPGQTVVCAQSAAVGARVAQERLGIPLVTAHLQPLWMRSCRDMPPMPLWMSRLIGPPIHRIVDFFVDNTFRRDIERVCEPLGVHVGRGMIRTWWNSPQGILGFWPDWFSPPQTDWPSQTILAGFPLPDVMDPNFDQVPLNEFLNAGEPPIVFTHGSNDPHAGPFFEASIAVAKRLQRRAILLCPISESVPQQLPSGVACFPYVPLDVLLPRSAAHVHHGGVGTISLSLKAGIPQLTVPSAFDQPDNSERLARLGVSRVVKPHRYRPDNVARLLQQLLDSADVRSRCQEYALRFEAADPFGVAGEVLERLAGGAPLIRRDVADASRPHATHATSPRATVSQSRGRR